jgi:hypothetical protein
MTIESIAPILGASGALSLLAMKTPDLLKEIYGDLAKPGVQQVGMALKTVLQLGSNILLPFRLLNETACAFEKSKFEDIAKRFSQIPQEDIIEISPEIGTPILEKLSYVQDETLRTMFIELLAKSSSASQVDLAHPSFVNLISSMSPDEAVMIKSFSGIANIPFISLEAVNPTNSSSIMIADLIISTPNGVSFPDRIPLYLSNLAGLGILEMRRDTYITDDNIYANLESFGKLQNNIGPTINVKNEVRLVEAKKHIFIVQPYGKSFISACT